MDERQPLPGPSAGTIKRTWDDFRVEEIPLYAPSGSGQHVYLTLRRAGRSTDELVHALASLFDLRPSSVGVAGRKDKHAVATQTVSLDLARIAPDDVAARVRAELGCEVLAAARHANRLRRGHLLGNRFDVLVRDVTPAALAEVDRRAAELARDGFANRFGAQRYGRAGTNVARGRALLERPRRRRGQDDLLLSAWQSSVFDAWIDARLELGPIGRPLAGDLLRVERTGGLFPCLDLAAEAERAARGEVVPTGPLFGSRMRWPSEAAGRLERALLERHGASEAQLAAARLLGARRAARAWPKELVLAREPDGLRVAFALAKGGYATVLLEALLGPLADASLSS